MDEHYICDVCGWEGDDPNWDDVPYCPDCGNDLIEEEDELRAAA